MGQILAWRRRRFQHIRCPEIAEAFAVRTAVYFAQELNLANVTFEGDCLNVVKQMNNSSRLLSPAGGILDEAKTISSCFQFCNFTFVRRSGNLLAHSLAKNVETDDDGWSVLPPDITSDVR